MIFTIRDIQVEIEDSLANLPKVSLPEELEGLRHLVRGDRHPQVAIRRVDKANRKVREDAAASYFDPDTCELVVTFVAPEVRRNEDGRPETIPNLARQSGPDLEDEEAIGQLIEQLEAIEAKLPFVGLKLFRDQVLPSCGHRWAADPSTIRSLLQRCTDAGLILTSKVHNPDQPAYPTTAIRVNHRHPRFQPEVRERRSRFTPTPISGGVISDTVLGDRR